MTIKCRLCRKEKSADEYGFFRGERNKSCKECREKNNLWYSQDISGRRTKNRNRYHDNKEKVAAYRSDVRLAKKYSLTRQEWIAMLKKQNNKCKICESSFNELHPCVDHNHETGKVRSLLCRRCNLDLQVVENKEFVKKAQTYLKSMK